MITYNEALKENYCALALAILKGCTPEEAFEWLATGKKQMTRKTSKNITSEIVRLKNKGLTNKEVGDILGLSAHAVSKRYNRYKSKRRDVSMTKQEYIDWHIRVYNTPPKRYLLEKYFDKDGNMKPLDEVNFKPDKKGAKKNVG